jgi:integrase
VAKLYHLTGPKFELPEALGFHGELIRSPASNFPTMHWPDGRWCYEANGFLLMLHERRLSRQFGGGSLRTYAANLSHLLRFVDRNKIELASFTDAQFSLFMRGLAVDRRESQPEVPKRDANSILAIGRLSLDFLSWFGSSRGLPCLVGPTAQIRAERRRSKTDVSGKSIEHEYWHHHSFPVADPRKRRRPISASLIGRLTDAVLTASTTRFQRRRRYVMLLLLEITGGRRSEICALTVAAVRAASLMPKPSLRFRSSKTRSGTDKYREVPVARHDIAALIDYIEHARKPTISRTCGSASDQGFVLISETTGQALVPNTITQEVAALRTHAGIAEQACAHMFRHRFLTKIIVSLAEQHNATNKDAFRKSLLDHERLKEIARQWSGHSRISSIDCYVDYAFDELTSFRRTYDEVALSAALDSFATTLSHIEAELLAGEPPSLVAGRLRNLVRELQLEIKPKAINERG